MLNTINKFTYFLLLNKDLLFGFFIYNHHKIELLYNSKLL